MWIQKTIGETPNVILFMEMRFKGGFARDCEHRFSDPNDVKKSWSNKEKTARTHLSNEIKMATDLVTTQQICVGETEDTAMQNLKHLKFF